ncbi:50S ribosomal protein L23 [Acholeplasma oculi]|uniref:Large ribosomal subunit protein uL23 n=1 Tax=Acholeplasma oculi TaxID=35623 RepID=A0A061AC40_9MOLU|nr:50S ribosomal protein L23 [Acholeplasma oculi]CDR31440.1 50S ribosomal protein L23 [Acholeplasma oculi]SKC40014.1 large subunit ribosomal protein L23 [Acholeplasma oculi]SUT92056.1 50S ribosomal protein L23 [Acholeplasma oculi]HLS99937.1 50S ribosomal protein L23 [Acholeplasma sp.]
MAKVVDAKYYDLLRTPIITENSMQLVESANRYTFKVPKTANKVEIKKAVEAVFGVEVIKVNTITVLPKYKKVGKYAGLKPGYKKAIVQLKEGQKIPAFAV